LELADGQEIGICRHNVVRLRLQSGVEDRIIVWIGMNEALRSCRNLNKLGCAQDSSLGESGLTASSMQIGAARK